MASQNIARLGVVLGLDTAEFTASIDKAISENAKLKNAIKRDTNSAAGELKTLVHATEDYGKALTKVELIQREVTSGRFMNATQEMKSRLLQQAAAYDKVALSAKNAAGAQFKMNEQQRLGLTYQTTDLFTQLASGHNPLIAIIQQGGQLKDSMGGVKNMLTAIGSLFTVVSVSATVFAASVGSIGYALYKAKDDLDKFNDAMTLTGGFAGKTYDSILNIGELLSNKTSASIGSARDVMHQLAASGKFTATSIEEVAEVILRFSKISGTDAAKAAETLIPLLNGTASAAKQLNDRYHFLNLEQYKNIEALEKQGKLQESAKLQAILLNESLMSTQRQLGTLESAWEGVRNFASRAWDAMLGIGREDGMSRANELQKKINDIALDIESRQSKGMNSKKQEAVLKYFQTELQAIVKKETAAIDATEARAKKVEENQKKIAAYVGGGGSSKSGDIQAATEKALAEVRYLQAIKSANEIQKIELEAEKKINDKKLEFSKKTSEEKRAFGGLLQKQQDAEILAIELQREEKITQVRTKNSQLLFAEEQRMRDEMGAAFVAESKGNEAKAAAEQAIRSAAQAQTKELDYQRESLELKNQMIYASETDLKLAQISLEFTRKRKEAEKSPEKDFLLKELDRQEEMRVMFVFMEDSAKRMQSVFDTVWGSMSAMIDNFTKTGKLNVKEFARSAIQDLISIQLKAGAMKFLGALFPQLSFGGLGGLQQRASGGTVTNNTSYLVGERGPEMFVPNGSGTIIPNNQIGNMGGSTNVTNNYINAIDAKSFETRLLESSNTIWAGYQYANKQLASGGRRA